MESLKDKVKGCLLGGAIGDALGYPVEFVYSYKSIEREYGKGGIQKYDLRYPWLSHKVKEAQISDDTQMTIYTLNALLESDRKGVPLMEEMIRQYLGWFYGQVGNTITGNLKSELTEIEQLNQRRAPGNTCLSALNAISRGEKVVNNSKGCGGVMRVAPIGIFGAIKKWKLADTAKTAADVGEITHLHPLSNYSSACLAVIIQQCLAESPKSLHDFRAIVVNSLDVLEEVYGPYAPELNNFSRLIENAIEKVSSPACDWEVIENELGEGWVAEETLAIAIFCVARHIDDFREAIVSAVNHGGDSDSTGAVAGNIIGAILGMTGIPEEYISQLQLTNLMLDMAKQALE